MGRLSSGVVLGVGLGGFADGILLHQIAQWHNMGSAVLPPTTMEAMSRNMTWDGLFHLLAWAVTLAGVYMLWHEVREDQTAPTARVLTGQMLFGWGIFNVIEGVVDHHILQLHHVRDVPFHVPLYDWVFLAVGGIGLILLGLAMMVPSSFVSATRS